MIVAFNKVILTILCFSLRPAESRILYAEKDNAVLDEWIVVMKDQSQASAFSAQSAATLAATVPGVKVKDTFNSAITGFSAKMSEKAAKYLAQDPSVDFVEQNARVYQSDVTWGLDRVDERDLPLDGSFAPSGDGEDVIAYIIDTGIQTNHQEFTGRIRWGTNTIDGDNSDGNGHGTHVAGTVGGTTYGVAKKVELVAVKVLSNGGGTTTSVINGVNWAKNDAEEQGKKATANLSLGGGYSTALNQAVKGLHESGVVTVVAAGNDNQNACGYSPASEPAVITVASSTSSDARSSFSNYGNCVDIFAPGSSIKSAWIGSSSAVNTISGTSMASPHVCGGAALLLASGNYSYQQVTDMLMSRATESKISNPGAGSPNKLLYVAETGPAPSPTPAPNNCSNGQVPFELNLKTDNYPQETTWELVNSCGDQVLNGGPYTNSATDHNVNECVDPHFYTFTISDSWGDGICCGYGSGSYSVEYNGSLVIEGGDFGSFESDTFGEAPTGGCTSTKTFKLTLKTDNYPKETTWDLTNTCTNERVSSGGPYNNAQTDYTEEEELAPAQYRFTISDSWGDGICCGYGSGSYSIEYGGETKKEGGQFGSSETTTFGNCPSNPASAESNNYKPKPPRSLSQTKPEYTKKEAQPVKLKSGLRGPSK